MSTIPKIRLASPVRTFVLRVSNVASCISIVVVLINLAGCASLTSGADFQSRWPKGIERTWIGPEYWANPLQDWQLKAGRIECVTSGGDRNVFWLTCELGDEPGTLNMSVVIGRLDNDNQMLDQGWVGFKLGVRGEFNDYRDNAVRGVGLRAGMHTAGQLFIGKHDDSAANIKPPFRDIRLVLSAVPRGRKYLVTLTAYKEGRKLSEISRNDIDTDWLIGGVALACSHGKVSDASNRRPKIDDGNWGFREGTGRGGNVRFWFKDWKLSGSKVEVHKERVFGPILFAQHTLSSGVMKMTAQMPPVGKQDSQFVELQIKKQTRWVSIGKAEIDSMARTATFRSENWDSSKNTPYRLVYELTGADGKIEKHYFRGTIRSQPWQKEEIVVAVFTGNNDLGFPNNDFVKHVEYHKPDLLFFSGDQIYEGVGGFDVQRSPVEKACIDYLRKWYLYGWAYRKLLRDIPAISIPDDHDVYHGNLWGAGGRPTVKGLTGHEAQDTGGYKMPPEWVNMVQRTQTNHLPDPYDPTPIQQGIGVYYCQMNYGGISFAIIEDRKFKSAPKMLLPEAKIWNGWPQNRNFNVREEADVPGAKLLGDRQLEFLRDWAADWSNGTWMKVVLSQTIFANVATLPAREMSDVNVPKLRILEQGEYPGNDKPVTDLDSNGWPQTGRNKALREMRRGFAFHLAGDQHLGSTIQYGVEDWRDAGFAFCVPAVSNVWPRRWCPSEPGANRKPGSPKYTGDFEDGLGNKITVHAVSNPVYTGLQPSRLYDRATGYGIVRFNRKNRQITIECWPRLSDPSKPAARQYPGWPVTANQMDNYGRKASAYLPTVEVTGMTDPVIQVIDEDNGEIVYTLRIKGHTFRPKVFKAGTYSVKVGKPETERFKTLRGLKSLPPGKTKTVTVKF